MTADAVGGVLTYVVELCRGLSAVGVETVVAVLGPSPTPGQRRDLVDAGAQLHERPYALEWMDDPWEDVGEASRWLLQLEEEVQPDVVHLNGYAQASLAASRPLVVVAHSDVLSWHEAVHDRPAGPQWDLYRRAVSAGLSAADVVVAPTHAMLDAIRRHYRIAAPTVVIENGRTPLRPLPKEHLIAVVGRLWDEGKNAAALERVAPRLSWPVEYARGDRSQSEVAHLLGRASIFALPARYEPFGLTPLEAASAGAALVLGDIDSLREVWEEAAIYVRPDDEARLGLALEQLIEEEPLREEMQQRALVRSRAFTPERMVRRYLDLYRSLARDAIEAA